MLSCLNKENEALWTFWGFSILLKGVLTPPQWPTHFLIFGLQLRLEPRTFCFSGHSPTDWAITASDLNLRRFWNSCGFPGTALKIMICQRIIFLLFPSGRSGWELDRVRTDGIFSSRLLQLDLIIRQLAAVWLKHFLLVHIFTPAVMGIKKFPEFNNLDYIQLSMYIKHLSTLKHAEHK